MKTLHYSIIAIIFFISILAYSDLAFAQSPDVACGWVTAFHKYEFNETDVIPITFHDPCYPQEGKTLVVTVSDGNSTKITGKYLNQTVVATNNTVTIDFKKPTNSTQYRFLVALGNGDSTGAFIFTKPNASKLVIVDPSVSSIVGKTGQILVHAKLLDGLGNLVTQEIGGARINVEFLLPQCDFDRKCTNPDLDLTSNTSNQTSYGLMSIPNDLATGTYNLTFIAGSYYPGYQRTSSTIIPVSITNGEMESVTNSTRVPEFPFASVVLLTSIASVIVFYRFKFGMN